MKYLEGIDSALVSSDMVFEFSRLYERIGVEKPSRENVFENFNQAVALMPNLGDVLFVNETQGLVVVADSLLKQYGADVLEVIEGTPITPHKGWCRKNHGTDRCVNGQCYRRQQSSYRKPAPALSNL